MPEYLYRIQPARADMLSAGATPAEGAAVEAHFRYLQAAAECGIVLLAGRTLVTTPDSFGIVIFRAADDASARAFMLADPAVAAGVFIAELYPFRTALLAQPRPEEGS